MARARRTLDRKTLREQGDAAERKKKTGKDEEVAETDEDEDEDDEDEDESEEEGAEEEAEVVEDAGDADEDDDEKPKKKSKKKVPVPKKVKAPAKPRAKAKAKVVRMKVVWAVYSNSHTLLEEFPYPKKHDAEVYLNKITNDKKSGGPFFMQLFKKPMDKE